MFVLWQGSSRKNLIFHVEMEAVDASSGKQKISSPLMELFIETLMGTSIVVHVSPLDTVLDVKTYIQKMEGL